MYAPGLRPTASCSHCPGLSFSSAPPQPCRLPPSASSLGSQRGRNLQKFLIGTNLKNLGLCQYITYTKTILRAVFFFVFVFFKEFYYQNLSFFSFLFLWFFPSPHFLPPSWLGLQDTHQDTTKNLNLVHSFINTNLQFT